MDTKTYTITFGDQAENHAGMQKIGTLASEGFHLSDLKVAQEWFTKNNVSCELIDLTTLLDGSGYKHEGEAYILIARKGLDAILLDHSSDDFMKEQDSLKKDTKAFMYGRVVNKLARHNLCFGPESQEASYETGKGTIVSFKDVPILNHIKEHLPDVIGTKGKDLMAEGNYYYDINKCGIGWHGDAERRKVVGIRVGATLPLSYHWFFQSKPVGIKMDLYLNHGDIYIMSEKTTGYDWKKRKIPTLRHAAGSRKYISLPK